MTQLDTIGAACRQAVAFDRQLRSAQPCRVHHVDRGPVWFCRRNFWLIAVLAVIACVVVGCKGEEIAAILRGEPTPATEFQPPEKVEPVSPPVAQATTQASDARGHVLAARDTVATLTPANVDARRPGLISVLGLAVGSLDELQAKLATASAAAKSADAAVIRMTDVIISTQQLVLAREAEMKGREEARAKREAQLLKERDEALAAANSEAKKDLDRMLRLGVLGGGIAIAAGVWLLIKGKDEAVYVIGGGALTAALSFAGIHFSREIAQAAMLASVFAVLAAAYLAVRKWKQIAEQRRRESASLILGTEHAKIAGAIPPEAWPRIREHLEMAAEPGVAEIVRAETK